MLQNAVYTHSWIWLCHEENENLSFKATDMEQEETELNDINQA